MPRQRRVGGELAASARSKLALKLNPPLVSEIEDDDEGSSSSQSEEGGETKLDYLGNKCLVIFLFTTTAIVVTCIKFMLIPS